MDRGAEWGHLTHNLDFRDMARILIIDDERLIRHALRDILEYEKHEVADAEDGNAGLKAALEGRFDVIFCDVKMPGKDGIEVVSYDIPSSYQCKEVMASPLHVQFFDLRRGTGITKKSHSRRSRISNDRLKFWAKYLCFHHDDPRVAAVPESLSLLHSYLCM